MTPVQFSLVFGLGVVSSLHCVQMCGPIVIAYSLPLAKGSGLRREFLLAHVLYNLGRITTYTALGALAGVAGGALGMLGKLAGVANSARIVAGAAMILAGIFLSGAVSATRLLQLGRPGVLSRLSRSVGRLMFSSRIRGKYALGVLLGFLPCGLVYAALLKSVEAGSAGAGAATMFAFGLGTAIALAGAGVASTAFGARLGPWSNRLAAASVTLLGAYVLWHGLMPGVPPEACHGHE